MKYVDTIGGWLVIIASIITGTMMFTHYRDERLNKDAAFQRYIVDHKCKRTGFVPSGKEIASIYTCDTGVWLASEIWNLKK